MLAYWTALLLAAAPVLGICPDGNVAVGNTQTGTWVYDTPQLSMLTGVIMANDCGVIAISQDKGPGYCVSDFSDGASITCDGNGVPTNVTTQGGDFGNCQKNNDGSCAGVPFDTYYMDYCCERL